MLNRKIEKAHVCHKTEKQRKAVVNVKLNKTDEKVYQTLKTEGKELTLQELTDKTGEPSKKVFKSLRKLFEHEIIETQARKYKLTGKNPSCKQRRTRTTRRIKFSGASGGPCSRGLLLTRQPLYWAELSRHPSKDAQITPTHKKQPK